VPDGVTPDTVAPGGGHRGRPALSRCVAVSTTGFAGEYWGRRPLLTRAKEFETAGFADLLSVEDVDDLLGRRGLRTPFLRIAKDGAVLPASRFTGGGGAGAEVADQVIDEKILSLYAGGATLVLQGLHRLWPPLVDFAGRLGAELGCPVQVNAYVTPPGNRGFAAHYDTHDVVVLQVDGRKRWQIHPPVLVDPLERQPSGARAEEVAATTSGPPELDVVLAPGDSLYLPRGWLHAAEALGERTVHLTLGLRRPTRYTLVEALLRLAAGDERLRAGLPLGLDLTDPGQLGPSLSDTVAALRGWLSTVDPSEVSEQLRPAQWASRRPAPIRPLAQAAALSTVEHSTMVRARPGLRWRLVPAAEGQVALSLPDRTVTFPAWCAGAVRAALRGGPIRVADLPGLDAEDQVVLVRRLLREAALVPLVPVSSTEPPGTTG